MTESTSIRPPSPLGRRALRWGAVAAVGALIAAASFVEPDQASVELKREARLRR